MCQPLPPVLIVSLKTKGTFTTMTRCLVLALLLLMSSAGFAFSGGHSHYFYSTLTYNSSVDFSTFRSTRTIDDVTLFSYESDNGVLERRVPWFKAANKSLWDASDDEHWFNGEMQKTLYRIMDYLNYTEGFHILQNIAGCELLDNGTVRLIRDYHYNGIPLMFTNWETLKWTAELPEYEDVVEDLFGNENITEKEKSDSLKGCGLHIKELLELGKCTFGRNVPPVVKVTQIPIDNVRVKLCCRAYGHYPKNISIMWYKNGEQIWEEMMERMTLPIPGLTYLTSVSFNVTSAADDVYTCKVKHSSMRRDFTKHWRISSDYENLSSVASNLSIGAVIAICLAVTLAILVVVFGSVLFAKSRRQ